MTTTELPRPGRKRPGGLTNLRLYLIASLAAVYLLAWWSFGTRARRPAALPAPTPGRAPSEPSRLAIWYADLPSASRPVVALPPGWHVAEPSTTSTGSSGPTAREPGPVPVRVAPARRGRIRTRSS